MEDLDYTPESSADSVPGENRERKADVPEAESNHVKQLLEWVKRCRDYKEFDGKTYREKVKTWRDYAAGRQNDDGQSGIARANLIHDIIKKSVNRVYARNPEISIVPDDYVGKDKIKLFREFGRTSEIIVNYFMRRARIKRKAKTAVRASKTVRVGWVKVILQVKKEIDPIIKTRLHDSQDNLQRLVGLRQQIAECSDEQKKKTLILEHQQLVDSLNKRAEVDVAIGFAVYNVLSENIVMDPLEVKNLDDYDHACRIAELIPMTHEEAVEEFGEEKASRLQFFNPDTTDNPGMDGGNASLGLDKNNGVHWIYEIWDRKQMKVYQVAHGGKEYLKEPWTPTNTGEQWYPYFKLAMNPVDGEHYPLSDVELIGPLQDEINTALTNFKEHREKAVPFTVCNKADISQEDHGKVSSPTRLEVLALDGQPGIPAKNLFHVFEYPPIDPAAYTTEHLERLMERLTSGGDINQPQNNRSQTLGEAQLLSGAIQTDTDADQDEIEDWYHRLATYVWQVCLLVFNTEQVKEIAGEGAVWPAAKQTRETIYNQMRLTVRAGSSGKPDKVREQVSLSKAMPVAQEMILKIAELKQGGQNEMAEIMKKLTQEFLRRADEKIDVDEFFQESGDEENSQDNERMQQQAAQMQQMQEQQKLMEAQLEKLMADIEKTRSETAKNLVEAGAKEQEVKNRQADTAIKLAQTVKDFATPQQPEPAQQMN